MHNTDLLIFYCPGSRGDFLAAVLTDQIREHYQEYAILDLKNLYHKMHGLDSDNAPFNKALDETSILKYRDQSIRIKLRPSDYATVAKLAITKNLPFTRGFQEMCSQVEMWEKQYRKLDIKFRHVVWFSDLFDIEFLKKFYYQFNNRPMPADLVPLIEYNIALQSKFYNQTKSET